MPEKRESEPDRIMDKIARLIDRFPVILAVTFLLLGTLLCWYIFSKYQNTNIYYLLNVINLVSVFLLIVAATRHQNYKIRTALLLSAASMLLVLTVYDFYLITFDYDTSGPGGENVITHRHWFNKYVSKNEYGFWERSLARFENPDNRNRELVIAVVGDSFTWGQGVKGNSYRLTEQLEQRLNSTPHAKDVRVLNFGKGGADTVRELEVVKKYVSKIHPDIVLICYLSNDIDSDSFISYLKDYGDTVERLSTISPTINFLYWRLIGPNKYRNIGLKYMNGLVDFYENPELFNKHMDDLDTLFKDVKSMGAQPIFVLMPFPQMWKMFPGETRNNIYNRIKRAVTNAGIPIIDLSYIEEKYTLEEFQVNCFDAHPNEKMHEEFAGKIYQGLVNNPEIANLLKKQ